MIGPWLNDFLKRTDPFPQTNEVNIAIRTDTLRVIGSGHLMRCLVDGLCFKVWRNELNSSEYCETASE